MTMFLLLEIMNLTLDIKYVCYVNVILVLIRKSYAILTLIRKTLIQGVLLYEFILAKSALTVCANLKCLLKEICFMFVFGKI